MIIDFQQPFTDGGVIIFPDYYFGEQPKPASEIIETVILEGSNSAIGGITGTVDN